MKEFHGYYLKIFDDKTEIYKNRVLVATLDNEESAKSYIMNTLKAGE